MASGVAPGATLEVDPLEEPSSDAECSTALQPGISSAAAATEARPAGRNLGLAARTPPPASGYPAAAAAGDVPRSTEAAAAAATAVADAVDPFADPELLSYTPSASSTARRCTVDFIGTVCDEPVSWPEKRLLNLHAAEVQAASARDSPLAQEFAELFLRLPANAVGRVRAALDSNIIFRQDNSLADFRCLFKGLSSSQQKLVLERITESCPVPPRSTRGFVLLSDVDDTLLPGKDALQVSGSDRSWPLDGRLYPGVSRLHHELRGGLRDDHGLDYSVLLTARPPAFARELATKVRRIALRGKDPRTDEDVLRLSILPGEGGPKLIFNAFRVLTGDFTQVGQTKIDRVCEYAAFFPDYKGRFVFIGDDGQADLEVARIMLEKADALIAFVAVKAVQQRGDNYVVSPGKREDILEELRRKCRPLPAQDAVPAIDAASAGKLRHRFFYFLDYLDLSLQLYEAGWLVEEQHAAILRAASRDKLHLAACVQACDLKALKTAIQGWSLSGNEADPCEQEVFERAGCRLPDISMAHVQLSPPPVGASAIRLQLLNVVSGDFRWPSAEVGIPGLVLRAVGGDRPGVWCSSDDHGGLNIEWPCPLLFRASAPGELQGAVVRSSLLSFSRAAIDVVNPSTGLRVGRCFLVVEDSSGSVRDAAVVEARLLSPCDWPDAQRPIGELTLGVRWLMDAPKQQPRRFSFLRRGSV